MFRLSDRFGNPEIAGFCHITPGGAIFWQFAVRIQGPDRLAGDAVWIEPVSSQIPCYQGI